MITFFAITRPFEGEFDEIQRTAISSWKSAVPDAQVLLFGDHEGMAQICRELQVEYVPGIRTNDLGTEMVSDAWQKAMDLARYTWICALNADNVMGGEILDVIEALDDVERPFVIGQRWDISPGADPETAVLHAPYGVDWFLFRSSVVGGIDPTEIPPFAVGRTCYDNWLVWAAIKRWNMTVIDATKVLTVIHLNHGHPEYGNEEKLIQSKEKEYNVELMYEGGAPRPFGIPDAPYILEHGEVKRRV